MDEIQAEQELERSDYAETIKRQQEQIDELLKEAGKPRREKTVQFTC